MDSHQIFTFYFYCRTALEAAAEDSEQLADDLANMLARLEAADDR